MKEKLLVLFLLAFLGLSAQAQQKKISGKVTSEKDGLPIPGVSVIVPGGKIAAQTGADGVYNIAVPENTSSLIFRYIGYVTQTLKITAPRLNAVLIEESNSLSEVTITTGYTTQKKADNIGSISSISGKDLENKPIQSFDQALGGKAAGVQITVPNGVLNNPPVIRIRGTNSISLSSYPLIIVDGVATYTGDLSGTSAPGNALASINPNDIERLEVLKDAAASAIYGSRGANGVIVVTTKKGRAGKATVSYDSWVGTTKARGLPELLDAYQYTDLKNEGLRNAGTFDNTNAVLANRRYFALSNDAEGNVINTNWYDYIYRTAYSHSNSLSISGGSESTNYYLSGSYTKQQGIVMNNNYNRKAGLFKVDHKEGKIFVVGGKISYSNEENLSATSTGSLAGEAFGTGGLGRLAIVTAPNVSPYNNDGTYSVFNATTIGRGANVGSDVGFYNPAAVLNLDRSNNEINHIQSNIYVQANIFPWLNAKSVYGIDYIFSDNDSFSNPINGGSAASGGSAAESLTKNKRWVLTNTIQADKSFGEKHNFSLLLGNEQQRSTSLGFGAGRTTLSDPAFNVFAAGYATPSTSASIGENYLVSFFSGLTYNYDKKYYLNANVRQDEYSAFGADNKKGVFYGVALGWEIAREKFWTNMGLDKTFSSFKIRGSYGTVGNTNGLGNLASYSFYSTGLYNGASTLVPSQTGNDQIGWEESKKLDVGFNFGMLNDRITVEAAYYKNTLDGLIYNVPQVPSAGLPSTPQLNIASMYNKGFEFAITADAVKTETFSWSPSFNISYNENKITSLSEGLTQFIQATSSLESASISKVGGPLGMIYAVQTAGVDPATGRRIFIEKSTGKKVLYQQVAPTGQFRYAYEDGTEAKNGISLNNDGIPYKNTQPKFIGGFDNTFRYKQFDLGLTFTYQLGFYIYYGTNSGLRDQRFWNNSTDMLRRWTTPGQVTDIPKIINGDNVSNGSSFPLDINVFKGDFLKLRSASFGYTFPRNLVSKVKLSNARIYISGSNLLIWTKYPGSDPEVSSNGNSIGGNASSGIERNSVGNGRAFTAGLSVKF